MPQRLADINRILEDVETKGAAYLRILQNQEFNIKYGFLPIMQDPIGRPTFAFNPLGYPIWYDIYFSASEVVSNISLGLGYGPEYPEYNAEYQNYLNFLAYNASRGGLLDWTDVFEGLLLASLARDFRMAEEFCNRLTKELLEQPNERPNLEEYLGRGNSRIRAATGRVLASTTPNGEQEKLFDYVLQEMLDGVRAEIITVLTRKQWPNGIPEDVQRQWLGGSSLTDCLSFLLGIVELMTPLPNEFLDKINPSNYEKIKIWFAK
jgi:hypothetical protein